MTFDYECNGNSDMELQKWSGQVHILQTRHDYCEAEVSARGSSYHLICGRHTDGNYLCIPNWEIGSELGYLSDRFWNLERLTTHFPELPRVDAISIVDALVAISKNVTGTV